MTAATAKPIKNEPKSKCIEKLHFPHLLGHRPSRCSKDTPTAFTDHDLCSLANLLGNLRGLFNTASFTTIPHQERYRLTALLGTQGFVSRQGCGRYLRGL